MITFHKLTQAQYEKVAEKGNLTPDGLYFITDVGVIYLFTKRDGEEGSVTTFGTSVEMVDQFPGPNDVRLFCIYTKKDTKEQRMWDGSSWQIISYPITGQINDDLVTENADTTLPTTKAVHSFVTNQVAAAELGVQVRLHSPVYSLQDLKNLPLDDIEDKCMILVETVGLYRFDKQSLDDVTESSSPDAVVIPQEILDKVPQGSFVNRYQGRWIKMFNNTSYIKGNGIDITSILSENEINKIIQINADPEQFEFVDGKLTIKAGSQLVYSKVNKVYGKPDEIPVWNNDGNLDPSGYKFNTSNNLTNSETTISPDATISAFVSEIASKKLDDVKENSDGKIIVGKGNEGKVDASRYNVGSDFDDIRSENIYDIPQNTVATERAVKWNLKGALSWNEEFDRPLSTQIELY